jgi:glycosyltransferase involved in cell wall biosynthesis
MTGSGITLDAMVRHGGEAGWEQRAVAGVPRDDLSPAVGGLDPDRIHPLVFGDGVLDFPVPGMSDTMPYDSTRFRDMTPEQLDAYRGAWRRHVGGVVEKFRPDLIHAHHIWILGSLLKDVAPDLPVVSHCHSTGFRQMTLCPGLADGVKRGCARNDRFVVLHEGHASELRDKLGVGGERIRVVGAGFRDDLFHARGREAAPPADRPRRLLYVGKYSAAKGLPWLLDAFERIAARSNGVELHVAGGGSGPEAEELRSRMEAMAPDVVLHGQLTQPALAELARRCDVCVLPSFYEGVPLVLIEALACGSRLVATRLAGVLDRIEPHVGEALETVPLPRLRGADDPEPDDLPRFIDDLEATLVASLTRPPLGDPAVTLPGALEPFKWGAVFRRVESVWKELVP